VAKKETCTSKQTFKNNLTTKRNLIHKPSCAVLEISTSRKRQTCIQKHQPNTATPEKAAAKPNIEPNNPTNKRLAKKSGV
jgi:hypothetical protein